MSVHISVKSIFSASEHLLSLPLRMVAIQILVPFIMLSITHLKNRYYGPVRITPLFGRN